MKIYLDNAATTPMYPEVMEEMQSVMQQQFGNPSSIHTFGREAKVSVEASRKRIATLMHASSSEIIFTSGGTEADNMAIRGSIEGLGLKHAITSKIEHHAVLHTLEILEKKGLIKLNFVNLTDNGHIDLEHLEDLLKTNECSLVSLMHGNNEIGNLLPLKEVAEICAAHDAVFHSDTVQTVGHYNLDLSEMPGLHFIACSAHKLHGPKGVGFLYINGNNRINPLIHGGEQEMKMRGGTENVSGIAGLAKALEIAHQNMEEDRQYIQGLKSYMMEELEKHLPGVSFNGDAKGNSLYRILNVQFPPSDKAEMLIHNLDIAGIAASGGSACGSGSVKGSHVLEGIGCDMSKPATRFSFSKFNTKEEIDYCMKQLLELFAVKV